MAVQSRLQYRYCVVNCIICSPPSAGATSAPSLIFILPGTFYIRIIPKDQEPFLSRPKIQVLVSSFSYQRYYEFILVTSISLFFMCYWHRSLSFLFCRPHALLHWDSFLWLWVCHLSSLTGWPESLAVEVGTSCHDWTEILWNKMPSRALPVTQLPLICQVLVKKQKWKDKV